MQQKLILFYHFALSVIKSSLLKFREILTKIFYVLHKKDGYISSRQNFLTNATRYSFFKKNLFILSGAS